MHTIHDIKIDGFTAAYLEAAIWSSTHPDFQTERATDDTPETLDEYSIYDFSKEAIELAVKECSEFLEKTYNLVSNEENCTYGGCPSIEYAGHDFWLTRNGHGCGFWDGDWPKFGKRLTILTKKYRELNIWINDNNELEFE